ncbi:hypothetical protein LLH00_17900, partial [bacterium]|nr:hypothetical protein [bacterium]
PELKVRNSSEQAVLILDGEELEGAKQNRALNTTVLLRKKSETLIPVSCTEQGRWSYDTPEFKDSGNIMFRSVRASKIHAVSDSLNYCRRFDSNQGEIWNSISELHRESGTHSSTGAMKDFYSLRQESFDEYLKAFPAVENQHGLIVFIGDRVAGMDFVSRESAYRALHPKLLKSYSVESMFGVQDSQHQIAATQASEFLARAKEAHETKFKSPGHGWDHRFRGAGVIGSALVWRGQAVHSALFPEQNRGAGESGMRSATRRARFRGLQ